MPLLESEKLSLRRFTAADLPRIRELESDPEVMRFTPMLVPLSEERTAKRLQTILERAAERAPLGIWAAELKDTTEFVGWFMLLRLDQAHPELGFMIVRRHWGKGFATEAGARLLKYAFEELKLPALLAATMPENTASQKVLRKLGFRLVNTTEKACFFEILGSHPANL